MKKLKDKVSSLSISNKMLLALIPFLFFALWIYGSILIYNFEDVVDNQQSTVREKLLEQEKEKYRFVVKSMAETVSTFYLTNRGQLSEEKLLEQIKLILDESSFKDFGNLYMYQGQDIVLYDTSIDLTLNDNGLGSFRSFISFDEKRFDIVEILYQKTKEGGGFLRKTIKNPMTDSLEPKVFYVEPIEGTDYWITAGFYESVVATDFTGFSPIRNLNTIRYGVLIILGLIGIFLVKVFSAYMVQRFNRIENELGRICSGNLSRPLDVDKSSNDEFDKLLLGVQNMEESLYYMINNLAEAMETLSSFKKED